MAEPLLRIRALTKHYPVANSGLSRRRPVLRALDGVDLDVAEGETAAIVGESGCGKSTLGRCAIRLQRPTSGQVVFQGDHIESARGGELKRIRRRMQMVFQDPVESLDPRVRIGDAVREGLDLQGIGSRKERERSVGDMLERVGIGATIAGRYPHELSGGQQQRVVIARALILRPKLIVADEPVSALDVSVRSQILNLLLDLRAEYSLTFVLISHDLSVVGHMAQQIAVMYLGKIVESGPSSQVLAEALHPYTVSLLSAVLPLRGPATSARVVLEGEVPSPVDPPSGCRFRTRCPIAQPVCAEREPPLRMIRPGHLVACHFPGQFVAPNASESMRLAAASNRDNPHVPTINPTEESHAN